MLRKYSQTISKHFSAKFLHHLGENIERFFRLQNCLSQKSSISRKYSETFSPEKVSSSNQHYPSSNHQYPSRNQQSSKKQYPSCNQQSSNKQYSTRKQQPSHKQYPSCNQQSPSSKQQQQAVAATNSGNNLSRSHQHSSDKHLHD